MANNASCNYSSTRYCRSPISHISLQEAELVEGPRDASCQLKSCQLPRNSAETTCTTSLTKYQLRQNRAVDTRQRMTLCATNCSGRATELGGIIDLVDRRRPSLSRSERPPSNLLITRFSLSRAQNLIKQPLILRDIISTISVSS